SKYPGMCPHALAPISNNVLKIWLVGLLSIIRNQIAPCCVVISIKHVNKSTRLQKVVWISVCVIRPFPNRRKTVRNTSTLNLRPGLEACLPLCVAVRLVTAASNIHMHIQYAVILHVLKCGNTHTQFAGPELSYC